jgi:hypothetical protein
VMYHRGNPERKKPHKRFAEQKYLMTYKLIMWFVHIIPSRRWTINNFLCIT